MKPDPRARALALCLTAVLLVGSLAGAGLVLGADATVVPSANPALAASQAALSTVERDAAAAEQATAEIAQAGNLSDFIRDASGTQLRTLGIDVAEMSQAQFDAFAESLHFPSVGASLATLKTDIAAAYQTGLSTENFLGLTNIEWFDIGGATVDGCIIGSIVPAIGTAVGCIAGLAVGAGLVLWGLTFGQAAGYNDIRQWMASELQTLYNAIVLIDADYQTVLSLLNSTVYALDTEADAAALLQLDNATFNPSLDLTQSFVWNQLSSLQNSFLVETGYVWKLFVQWEGAYFQTGQIFACGGANNPDDYLFETTATGSVALGCGSHIQTFVGGNGTASSLVTVNTITTSGQFYIPQGASVLLAVEASSACQITVESPNPLLNVGASPTYFSTKSYTNGGSNPLLFSFNWSHESGTFWLNETTGACNLYTTAGMAVDPLISTVPAWNGGSELVACGTGNTAPQDVACNPLNYSTLSATGTVEPLSAPFNIYWYDPTHATYVSPILTIGGGAYAYFPVEVAALSYAAVVSAQVYFNFLHHLGYGYPSDTPVPPACVIPYPSQSVPPSWDTALGQMTVGQLTSLYVAWLNGLATFYDAAPNPSNFCSGHSVFNLGGSPMGDYFVNATGFVYLPFPSLYPNETFANISGTYSSGTGGAVLTSAQTTSLSTWGFNGSLSAPFWTNGTIAKNLTASCWTPTIAVSAPQTNTSVCPTALRVAAARNATQLLLWPISGVPYLNITVGTTFEIPADVPVAIYATEPSALVADATGNGTLTGRPAHGAAAGYAVFLTSCKVNGTAVKQCNVALSTIQGYIGNLTNCLTWGPSNGCKPPAPPVVNSGCYGSTWPFIGPILNTLYAAAGGIPLVGSVAACALAWVAVVIILVFVVGVVVFAVGLAVRSYRAGRGPRGG